MVYRDDENLSLLTAREKSSEPGGWRQWIRGICLSIIFIYSYRLGVLWCVYREEETLSLFLLTSNNKKTTPLYFILSLSPETNTKTRGSSSAPLLFGFVVIQKSNLTPLHTWFLF